jgi:hypothetical protein
LHVGHIYTAVAVYVPVGEALDHAASVLLRAKPGLNDSPGVALADDEVVGKVEARGGYGTAAGLVRLLSVGGTGAAQQEGCQQ